MASQRNTALTLGARLRSARLSRGWTQQELADQADVQLDTLRSIEQGRTRNPGVLTIAQLTAVLEVSIDALLRG